MEGNAETVSRPQKLEHVETILYEIKMLDYCYRRLREQKRDDENDYYLSIEGFLLHYRNLIQFFGNHTGLRARKSAEWTSKSLSDAEVASIQSGALLDEYDGPISRYLCHCSAIRAERDIEWKHVEMYEKIAPLLMNFRKLYRSRRTPRAVPGLDAASVSTATTHSHAPLMEDDSRAAPVKKPTNK
jgi:hypothetical protein